MTPIRALVVEDSEDDAVLLAREMRSGDIDFTYLRVETAEDMKAALASSSWDVVISDYNMPRFSAPAALRVLKETGLDLPFIVVSGTVGEDVAVETMKEGADDYLLKGNFTRLVPAVKRELEHAAQRRERRQAVEAHAQVAAIVESSIDAVISRTLDGIVLTWNGGAEKLYGYSREEVLGRPMSRHVPLDRAGEIQGYVERIRRGESVDRFETIRIRKDGTAIDVSLTVSPIRNIAGDVIGVSTIARDITKRKRAEEYLSRAERHFRSLIENAQDIITIIDMQGTIRFQSPASAHILGRPPEEFLGKSAFDLIHPDDAASVREAIGRAVRSPESAQAAVFRFRHANGTWRTLEGIGKVIPGEDPFQFVINSRDVTDSRALEEQLRQSQKMEAVGRLAGGIAHDFNNLLTAILGYAELLSGRLKAEDPTRNELSEIEKAGQRAAQLTRQLLAFSRKQVLQPRVISLNEIVGDTDKMLRRLIGEDIELVTLLKKPLSSVRADTSQIEQVLVNLAVNSRDAMPRGGRLTIETSEVELGENYSAFQFDVSPGPHVMLAVSDTGTGMDAKTLSRVFEPFFTTKPAGKGTGLGLSTVYGIVKQSGGHVAVYSEPGVGTTFKIYLPRVEGLPERASGSFKRKRQTAGTETVLVVEDEDAIRQLTNLILQKAGYTVLLAESPVAAEQIADSHPGPIHLMLTDVVMPGMRGPELAERLLRQRPDLRVLYMSGYTDDAIARHGFLDAGTDFLQKPFTPLGLMEKIREVLDRDSQDAASSSPSDG